jgi:hypothetical protein
MGHRRHAGERGNGALLREEPEALVFAGRAGSCGESDRYVAGIVTLFEPKKRLPVSAKGSIKPL